MVEVLFQTLSSIIVLEEIETSLYEADETINW